MMGLSVRSELGGSWLCVSEPRVVVVVAVLVAVIRIVQQPGAGEVNQETDDGNPDGFLKPDFDRFPESTKALPKDQQGHQRKTDSTAETAQRPHFSGAKTEPRIVGVMAGKGICKGRDSQRGSVGRHVPAVGQQSHGAKQGAAYNLGNHHHQGQQNDPPGAALGGQDFGGTKQVVVLGDSNGGGRMADGRWMMEDGARWRVSAPRTFELARARP